MPDTLTKDVERLTKKARTLLNAAGWTATREELFSALDSRRVVSFDAEDRIAIVVRALSMQKRPELAAAAIDSAYDDFIRGNRATDGEFAVVTEPDGAPLTFTTSAPEVGKDARSVPQSSEEQLTAPATLSEVTASPRGAVERALDAIDCAMEQLAAAEEVTFEGVYNPIPKDEATMPVQGDGQIDSSTVIEFLRQERAKDRSLAPKRGRELAAERFGIDCTYSSFYSRFWVKAEPPLTEVDRRRAPARTTPPERTLVVPPPERSAQPEVVGSPFVQLFNLSDGNLRLVVDLPPDLGQALKTLGAVIDARKQPA